MSDRIRRVAKFRFEISNLSFEISEQVSLRLTILGSGSAGNCTYLETDETRLLIDAGFSARQIRQRLASVERSPETLQGILITHEHTDHIQGLAVLCAKLQLPIYCNRLTRDAIDYSFRSRRSHRTTAAARLDFRLFQTGTPFMIGDVGVEPFSVPHDAQDPVGFLLRATGGNVGFLTDLGHATRLVLERVRPANVLVLETNHDLRLLQEDRHRPWSVKQRILSRHGHLSNEAAADVAQEVMTADLRHLYLGHLSRDCNRPELAYAALDQRLTRMGASHVQLASTSQDTPSPTLVL